MTPHAPNPRCPACAYSLAGLGAAICPECGRQLTEDDLAGVRRRGQKRFALPFVVCALCMYAPYAWVFVMDYPWNEYRWLWVKLYGGLPALFPVSLVAIRWGVAIEGTIGVTLMYVTSLGALAGLTWLMSRGWLWFVGVALLLLGASILNSVGAYNAFYM